MKAIRGDRVKQLREQRKLTQGQLAGFAKISQNYVSAIELGRRQNVGSSRLVEIARVLRTSADYLMGATDNPSSQPSFDGLSRAAKEAALLVDRFRTPSTREMALTVLRSLAEQEETYDTREVYEQTTEKVDQ